MEKTNDSSLRSGRLSAKKIRQLSGNGVPMERTAQLSLAQNLLDSGENFLAYDIAEKFAADSRSERCEKLRIMILALARSGSLKRATELLETLPDVDDSEIVGLKSRILKDVALNSDDGDKKREFFLRAGELSLAVFREKRQYYNGINAASCLLMAGDAKTAEELVREKVLPLCLAQPETDPWLCATLGECYLILRDFDKAKAFYSKAAEIAVARGQLGSFSSTLKQLQMLVEKIGGNAETLLKDAALPSIAVFSGHMIDRPDWTIPRFPAYAEEQVRRELEEVIRRKNIRIAFSSCACGGDILFMEEVLKQGGECCITPPLPLEKTFANSVDIIPGADWRGRLEALLKNDNVLLQEPECDLIGDESDVLVYDFTNRYILGQALLKQETMHLPLCGIAVWDGEKPGLPGGTDSAVALWQERGLECFFVKPEVNHD